MHDVPTMNVGHEDRPPWLQGDAKTRHGAFDEGASCLRRTEEACSLFPFGSHFLRLHSVLGEASPGAFLLLRDVAPTGFDEASTVLETQIECHLLPTALAKHHRSHEGIGDGTPFVREGHGHASHLTDLLGLAQDDVEDGTVDRARRREHHDRMDEFGGLAETVDATLPLLMAGRIPRKIVMNHRVEELLEIDPLRQAVGSDQNTLDLFLVFRRRHIGDRCFRNQVLVAAA